VVVGLTEGTRKIRCFLEEANKELLQILTGILFHIEGAAQVFTGQMLYL